MLVCEIIRCTGYTYFPFLMDQFVTRANPVLQNLTPRAKRTLEDNGQTLELVKKPKTATRNDALFSSNYYSSLQNDDGALKTPYITRRSKDPRLPPITLHQKLTNPKDTYEKIQSWAKKPVYFKQIGEVRHIYTTHKDDFVNIKQQLKSINFRWTSHNVEDDVHKKLILKGIDSSYTDSEVLDDLKKQFDSVIKVKQLQKTRENGEQSPLCVYHRISFSMVYTLCISNETLSYLCQ